jgi:zinc protease
MQITQQLQYERARNGVDVYLLPAPTKGLVIATVALPGGMSTLHDMQGTALLLNNLFPYSTKQMRRSAIQEQFAHYGATVNASVSAGYLCITCTTHQTTLLDTLTLVFDVLSDMHITQTDLRAGQKRVSGILEHIKEDTRVCATKALMHHLYKKKHPLWSPSINTLQEEVDATTPRDIHTQFGRLFRATGAFVSIVGDIKVRDVQQQVLNMAHRIPEGVTAQTSPLSVKDVRAQKKQQSTILSMKDKVNVDVIGGVPLFITCTDSQFLPLTAGVFVLGGSVTSRLFTALRLRENLTYGSNATLNGFEGGFPGYLSFRGIFPTTVAKKGRVILTRLVKEFTDTGISGKELQSFKEEFRGTYLIGLSSTRGLHTALLKTIARGLPTSHIDTYIERMEELKREDVNTAIRDHLYKRPITTVSAGAVDKNEKPL